MAHVLDRVDLFLVRLPMARPFTSSSHTETFQTHILIRARTADGAEGWGECAAQPDPYYSPETFETAWHILERFVVPGVLGRVWEHPDEAATAWGLVRGNPMARAGMEMACWDLYSRALGLPLAQAIGGTQRSIESGVSLGLEPTVEGLLEQIERFVGEGYRRVKVKIGPGRDLQYLRAIRDRWPELPLMADANSAYSLEEPADIAALEAIDELGLTMIEQPLAHDDFVDHAQLQKRLKTAICLDESIGSAEDARKAIELGSCRVINVKVARAGGISEAKRMHDVCRERGIPVWCGGMHEFGVGRAANIALNSLPGFTVPGDISGSDKAYALDLVDPPIRAHDGLVTVPLDRPGLGFEPNLERIRAATVRELTLTTKQAVVPS